ncbi:MAG TPA: hypothetical protein VIL98_06210 [Gaiellaceae bacterium]
MSGQRTKPAVDERQVTVEKGNNVVVVQASGHTWVALEGDEGEIVRDQSGNPETSFGVERGMYTVRSDGKLKSATARTIEVPQAATAADVASLRLTSNARRAHPVDGVGEIAADGKSHATITVQKLGEDGEPLDRRKDDDEVFLRTTGGTLQDDTGKPLRSVKLSGGKATFRIVSEPVGRVVTIEALGVAPLGSAELRLEFV